MVDFDHIENLLDPDNNHFDSFIDPSNTSMCNYISISDFNRKKQNYKSGLTILNYNIRSFSANFDVFISNFDNFHSIPDLLILTETWFKEDSLKEIPHFKDYHTIRQTHRSGGVSAYVKDNLNSNQIQNLSFSTPFIEICTIEIITNLNTFYVLSVYRPHSDLFDDFINCMNRILEDNLLRNKHVIVLGDFNINHLNLCNQTNSFLNLMQSFYMIPLITGPTRFSQINSNSSSLLDQIWTNKPLSSYDSGIISLDLTDHLPTYYHMPLNFSPNSENQKVKISFRLKNEESNSNFTHSLLSYDWNFLDRLDINQSVASFISTLNILYQQNFPLKTKYVTNKKVLNPWITEDISKLIKYKSEYYNLMKMNLITKEENRIFKNKVNSIVRKAKNLYYKNKFNSCQSDLKKTWCLINDILSPNRNKSQSIKLSVGNNEICENSELSEIFNTYFSNVASNLSSNIPNTPLNAVNLVPQSPVSFYLFPVSIDECSKIIRELKNSNTPLNELPVKIFKFNECLITPVLVKLINRCFETGIFPDCLKIATILPILKKGDPKSVKNYRPISILPYISKIFEKSIYNRLLHFFSYNNLLSKHQFGFLPKNSTLDAIQNFIEHQYNSLNENLFSINVFIDLSKAFDTINHKILLGKLEKYGVRGHALKFIKSYISDRKYRVKLGDCYSTSSVSNIGTAQGSVLAPLFFLIYVNDLPKFIDKCFPIFYADDTTLCFKSNSLQYAINECNNELVKFSKWCCANKLTINLEKNVFYGC